jgi:hypothetical protein
MQPNHGQVDPGGRWGFVCEIPCDKSGYWFKGASIKQGEGLAGSASFGAGKASYGGSPRIDAYASSSHAYKGETNESPLSAAGFL